MARLPMGCTVSCTRRGVTGRFAALPRHLPKCPKGRRRAARPGSGAAAVGRVESGGQNDRGRGCDLSGEDCPRYGQRGTIGAMSTTTFDTFKFVERLEKAGASRELAAALAEAQRESIAESLDTTLATKSDLTDVRIDLARLDAKVDKVQWMLGIVIAIAVANFAKQFF